MTERERNLEAFRRWRASVVRLAQWDRCRMEHDRALGRIIARAIESVSGPCDCPMCLARIVQEDIKHNWPKIPAPQY